MLAILLPIFSICLPPTLISNLNLVDLVSGENSSVPLNDHFQGYNLQYEVLNNSNISEIHQNYTLLNYNILLDKGEIIIKSKIVWIKSSQFEVMFTSNNKLLVYNIKSDPLQTDSLSLIKSFSLIDSNSFICGDIYFISSLSGVFLLCGKTTFTIGHSVSIYSVSDVKYQKWTLTFNDNITVDNICDMESTGFMYCFSPTQAIISVYQYIQYESDTMSILHTSCSLSDIDFKRPLAISQMLFFEPYYICSIDSSGYLSIIEYDKDYNTLSIISDIKSLLPITYGEIVDSNIFSILVAYSGSTVLMHWNYQNIYNLYPMFSYIYQDDGFEHIMKTCNNSDLLSSTDNFIGIVLQNSKAKLCIIRFMKKNGNAYNFIERDIEFDYSLCNNGQLKIKDMRYYDDAFLIITNTTNIIAYANSPSLYLKSNLMSYQNVTALNVMIKAKNNDGYLVTNVQIRYIPLALVNLLFPIPQMVDQVQYVNVNMPIGLMLDDYFDGLDSNYTFPPSDGKYIIYNAPRLEKSSIYSLNYSGKYKFFYQTEEEFSIQFILKSNYQHILDIVKIEMGHVTNITNATITISNNYYALLDGSYCEYVQCLFGAYILTNNNNQFFILVKFCASTSYQMQLIYSNSVSPSDAVVNANSYLLVADHETNLLYFSYAYNGKGYYSVYWMETAASAMSIYSTVYDTLVVSMYSLDEYLIIAATMDKIILLMLDVKQYIAYDTNFSFPASSKIIESFTFQKNIFMVSYNKIYKFSSDTFPTYYLECTFSTLYTDSFCLSNQGRAIMAVQGKFMFIVTTDRQTNYYLYFYQLDQNAINALIYSDQLNEKMQPDSVYFDIQGNIANVYLTYGSQISTYKYTPKTHFEISLTENAKLGELISPMVGVIGVNQSTMQFPLYLKRTISIELNGSIGQTQYVKTNNVSHINLYELGVYFNSEYSIVNGTGQYKISQGTICNITFCTNAKGQPYLDIGVRDELLYVLQGQFLMIYNLSIENINCTIEQIEISQFDMQNCLQIYPQSVLLGKDVIFIIGRDAVNQSITIKVIKINKNEITVLQSVPIMLQYSKALLSLDGSDIFILSPPIYNNITSQYIYSYLRHYIYQQGVGLTYTHSINLIDFSSYNLGMFSVISMATHPMYPNYLFLGTFDGYLLIYDKAQMKGINAIKISNYLNMTNVQITVITNASHYIFIGCSYGAMIIDPFESQAAYNISGMFASMPYNDAAIGSPISSIEVAYGSVVYATLTFENGSENVKKIKYIINNGSLQLAETKNSTHIKFLLTNINNNPSMIEYSTYSLEQKFLNLFPLAIQSEPIISYKNDLMIVIKSELGSTMKGIVLYNRMYWLIYGLMFAVTVSMIIVLIFVFWWVDIYSKETIQHIKDASMKRRSSLLLKLRYT